MLDAIYNFLQSQIGDSNFVINCLDNMTFDIGGFTIDGTNWLLFTISFIAYMVILVLCCLFVYKIIKLIGGLIR